MAIPKTESFQPVEAGRQSQEPTRSTLGGLGPILDDICRMVESSGRGVLCSVSLRTGEELSLAAAPGFSAETTRSFHPGHEDGHLTRPVLSAQGELLGLIALHYQDGQLEAPGDQELLRSASHLVGIAIAARHDALTGIPTRAHLMDRLDAILRTAPQPGSVAVLAMDLDRFQKINDSLGRTAGDGLLQETSRRLKSLLAGGDLAGRLAADEFAVVLTGQPGEAEALQRANAVLEALRAPYRIDGAELFVTASIGLAIFAEQGDAEELLRDAELAMHGAKRNGRNALEVFHSEKHARGVERLRLENALHRAIENRELELFYQPLVSMQEKVEGFEALLTWNHPIYGVVPPSQFIPIAEESGFIVELGAWVMQQACLAGARWHQAGHGEARLSVNVSAREFEQESFVNGLASVLAVSGFPPECLELELTESSVLQDLSKSAQRMAAIRELGVRIAIDDFGTGYSSLSYLSKLPVDSLKLDQSFLREAGSEGGALVLIQSVVRLAHGMNLTVVAEGVETSDQLDLVRVVGCDLAQGLFCGPPLRVDQVAEWLAR
jgi:diguanylate cyclase (GGDEF)-like protein